MKKMQMKKRVTHFKKKYSYDHMNIERPIEYNIKTQKEFNDSFYTNNIDTQNRIVVASS